jgi:hypothetical protein
MRTPKNVWVQRYLQASSVKEASEVALQRAVASHKQTVRRLQSDLSAATNLLADAKVTMRRAGLTPPGSLHGYRRREEDNAAALQHARRQLREMEAELKRARAATEAAQVAKRRTEANLRNMCVRVDEQGREAESLRNAVSIAPRPDNRMYITERRRSRALEVERDRLRAANEEAVAEVARSAAAAAVSQAGAAAAERRATSEEARSTALESKLAKQCASHKRALTKVSNRGRLIKKLRAGLSAAKEQGGGRGGALQSALKLPTRKLKAEVGARQQRRRRAKFIHSMKAALQCVSGAYGLNLDGYGALELCRDDDEEMSISSVKLRKGSSVSVQVKKFLALHDQKAVSKTKLHEVRMLTNAGPSIAQIKAYQDELTDLVEDTIEISSSEDHFMVDVFDMVRYVLESRGIPLEDSKGELTAHLCIEADGRGTGNHLKTVVMLFRVLNEGRMIHRADRAYLLALVKGDESHAMCKSTLGPVRKQLKELQASGINISDPSNPGETMHVNIVLHLLADGKWQAICHGMTSFATTRGKNARNCLFCPCHASKRADVEVYWHTYPDRFSNDRIGSFGQLREDLFPFIPVERRWMENMHLFLRFVGDKLVAEAITCIVNDEFETEADGMTYVEKQLQDKPIGISSFKFYAVRAKSRDPSAEAKLAWRSLSYTQLFCVAEHFEVASGFRKNPEKGRRLQRAMRGFVDMYKEIVVWPGDGPKVSDAAIFKANSELLADLLGRDLPRIHPQVVQAAPSPLQAGGPHDRDESGAAASSSSSASDSDDASPGESSASSGEESDEPGEDGHKETFFPRTTITPYAHMWNCHWGQMYERSKKLAYLFQNIGAAETNPDWAERGGLKPFLTQCLERTNLNFFHATFQSLDRHTAEFMYAAGMSMLRAMFNPETVDRSNHFCSWCGRGFVYNKRAIDHEAKRCKQRPPAIDMASAYNAAQAALDARGARA